MTLTINAIVAKRSTADNASESRNHGSMPKFPVKIIVRRITLASNENIMARADHKTMRCFTGLEV